MTEGYHPSGEFCPVTEERPNQGSDDAEYRRVVVSEALKACSDGPTEHTLDIRCKPIHTHADGILGRHSDYALFAASPRTTQTPARVRVGN